MGPIPGCVIEGGLPNTCYGETLGPIPGCVIEGGLPNTCYGETLGPIPGCIIEGDLLTQVQTYAKEILGPLTWLYYRGWPANTGPNTCYGDTLGLINLAVL